MILWTNEIFLFFLFQVRIDSLIDHADVYRSRMESNFNSYLW